LELAVLFGGASYEHEISIVSAVTMKEKLTGFDLTFVFCDQDHRFYLIDGAKMIAKTFASGDYAKMPELQMKLGGFEHKKLFGSVTVAMPVLNLIHGGDGEDGTIASMLEFYKIPFIGPRPAACALSFDKEFTKWLGSAVGVKTVAYEVLKRHEARAVATDYPFIVKPSRLGSSIGVSVVKSEAELDYALDVAFEFDSTVIIEPFYDGVTEYNLAGYASKEGLRYSIIEEPQKSGFLDFDKKYLDFSRTASVSQASVSDALAETMKTTFAKIYTGLFEGALIRCDFFVIDDELYLNEINPIPGSMGNYLFEDFQSAITELLGNLPEKNAPRVTYQYIHSINAAKGK
jgi:D-alanine-D-alanine ligase